VMESTSQQSTKMDSNFWQRNKKNLSFRF